MREELATFSCLLQQRALLEAEAEQLRADIVAARLADTEASAQQLRIWQHELQNVNVLRAPLLDVQLNNLQQLWDQTRLADFPELRLEISRRYSTVRAAMPPALQLCVACLPACMCVCI